MRRTTAFVITALLLAGTACTSSEPTATKAARTTASAAPTDTVWICRPGAPSAPCTDDLNVTDVKPGGVRVRRVIRPATDPPADCFYVYPTVSSAPGDNAPRASAPEIVATIHAQAAMFSSVCRVYAPAYRQVTTGALIRGKYLDPATQKIAYDDVRSAWRDYLAHDNKGRPFVLIGHSQGSLQLTKLVRDEIDSNAAVRRQLLSAILVGSNVTVADGKTTGGSFTSVPACTRVGQKGCVIAYSSFATTPPAYSLFGRTNNSGQHVMCTDPSRLAGHDGAAHPYIPADRVTVGPKPLPGTGFVGYPGGIRVSCTSLTGATWLQVSVVPGSGIPEFQASLGPAWGLHIADVTLALGDLVEAVRRQEVA
jgi:hypothetical protein